MKTRGRILLAMTVALTLVACGESKRETDMKDNTPNVSQVDVAKEEKLPATQEYVSADGSYKVILLQGLTQTDMQLQAGAAMMGLDGDSEWPGFSGVSLGCPKSNIPGNPTDVESLKDYADYITNMILDGSGVTVDWQDTDAPAAEGAKECLAREGIAKNGTGRGQAYGYYLASEDNYYSVVMIGNDSDIEGARQILSLEILDGALKQATTKDFINNMTAVLDSVNGANIRETYKTLEDAGADESQLMDLASQAQQSLSASWGVENTADLMETADWLMNEGHNQDALQSLEEYGGIRVTDREAFDAKLKEQNLDEGTYISLLAAYDAYLAYGEGAIAAWDLSRIGTIMGFGYASGYCTYEEAMDKMLEAAEKSQKLFESWEDFNQSYLYGYSYWAQESLDDSSSSAAERAELVSSMESQSNGPFAIEWKIELKKEW